MTRLLVVLVLGALAGESFSIQYLRPTSFPGLPTRVAETLQKMRCEIPQEVETRRPNNLIKGRFIRPGQTTWAALCSERGTSRIVVVDGRGKAVAALAERSDSTYMAPNFSRIILVATPDEIRNSDRNLGNRDPLPALDHDGIADGFQGKGGGILYFHRGRWLELAGSD
jgi:hypothetical protein